jgi:hypothetical protein
MAQEASQLMPGEDPESVHVDDARHWYAVYTELVDMARSVVKPPPSQRLGSHAYDAHDDEIVFINERVAVLEDRLEFWRQRLAQIETVG